MGMEACQEGQVIVEDTKRKYGSSTRLNKLEKALRWEQEQKNNTP